MEVLEHLDPLFDARISPALYARSGLRKGRAKAN